MSSSNAREFASGPHGSPSHVTGNVGPAVRHFSTEAFAARQRVEMWREVYGRTIVKLDIQPTAPEQFRADAKLRAFPGLGVMSLTCSPVIYRDGLAHGGSDDIVLSVSLSGSKLAPHRGREVELGAGDAIVMSGRERATLINLTVTRSISLRAPIATMARLVKDPAAAHCSRVPASCDTLRLLTGYVGILNEVDVLASPDLCQRAVTHVHDLMALTIGATREGGEIAMNRGAQAARLRVVKQDIADRLAQPDLSIATIALLHRCTPRYIQMLFETEGTTFTEYLLAQRLDRAYRTLTDPRHAREKVSSLAFDCGFAELTYFNRAFRRRYGDTPSGVRVQARAGA